MLTVLLAAGLLGAVPSQADVVAGSVRDQYGAPIAGARISLLAGGKVVGSARTAADGTFLFGGSASEVEIACRFCRSVRATVGEDGIATAIVTRYDAVASDEPTTADLEQLSSASPGTVLQLVPFVVVNETSRTLPGLSATDRNATPYGGLLVLDGAPDYDPNANATTFDTIPQGSISSVDVLRVDQAYRYGNVAQGGTFALNTSGGISQGALGNATLFRAAANDSTMQASAAMSNARVGVRAQRAAAAVAFLTPGTQGNVSVATGSGYASPNGASQLSSSFSSLSGELRTRGKIDGYARLTADRGSYAYTSARFPDAAVWSDAQIEAGVASDAAIAPFATVDLRQSSGSYLSPETGTDGLAGAVSQARATAGIAHHSDAIDVTVAAAHTALEYTGIPGPTMRESESANGGVASFTYRPFSHWSFHASTSAGYTLQTFLGLYIPGGTGYPYGNPVLRGHTREALVEYSDDKRLRIDATALAWAGENGVATSSAGAAIAWEIAPNVSLRSWVLRESSTPWAADTVGTAWLTFANNDLFRADMIWGRSLLDRTGHNHLEGTVSGRLSGRLDWFVTRTSVAGSQQSSVGVRIR